MSKTVRRAGKRLDWNHNIIPTVISLMEERKTQGIAQFTLRGIFYLLVSLKTIPNLVGYYKTLSRKLVEAREDGRIDDNSIVDESRWILDIDDDFKSPEEILEEEFNLINDLPNYYKTLIPRWYKQPNYVEVWLEKKAMASVVKSILHNYQVRIVPTGGWSSYSYEKENLARLSEKAREGKRVHVLYLGDYDPSGLRMVENMKERFWNSRINFLRIAITREQIQGFGLESLTNPDPEVMTKLQKDPNAESFRMNNDGKLFQIEVDALQVLSAETLRDLLISNVERHFDRHLYKEVISEPKFSSSKIRGLVHLLQFYSLTDQDHCRKRKL